MYETNSPPLGWKDKVLFAVMGACVLAAAAAFALSSGYAKGEEPTPAPLAVIDGPTESIAGILLEFDAIDSTGVGFAWSVTGPKNCDGLWNVYDKDGVKNRIMAFASPYPGKYIITLATAMGDEPAIAQVTLHNGKQPDPDPDPDDPPLPPDNKWQIVIVYESSTLGKLSPEQQSVIKSLTFRKRLAEAGHVILSGGIFDKDGIDRNNQVPESLAPFVAAVRDTKLPVLCIAPVASGTVQVFPLPADEDAVLKLLGGEKP